MKFFENIKTLLLLIPLFPLPSHSDEKLIEGIVAVVGDNPVLLSEVRETRTALKVFFGKNEISVQDALSYIIDSRTFEIAMKERGIVVEKDEIDFHLEEFARANNYKNVNEFLIALKNEGVSENTLREIIKFESLKSKYVRNFLLPRFFVSEEEILKTAQELIRKSELKLLKLTIYSSEDKNELLNFREKITKGENAPGEKVKISYLTGVTEEDLTPEMKKYLSHLKPNEPSSVLSLGDYYVFIIYEISENLREMDESVKKRIRNYIITRRVERELEKELKDLKNKIYIDLKNNLIKKLEEGY